MHRFVMAALVAATLPAPAAAQAVWIPSAATDTQRVSTHGIGEVVTSPRRATALFVIGAEGGEGVGVAREVAAVRDAAVRALVALGLEEASYALVSFGVGAAPGPMRSSAPGQPTPALVKEGKAALRVVIDPVDRLDAVVGAVLAAGAQSVFNVTFEPDETPEARGEAALLAMANARAEADAVAEAAGMRVGRLLQVFSTPDYARQAMASTIMRANFGQGIPLTPSDVTVRVILQAVWELRAR